MQSWLAGNTRVFVLWTDHDDSADAVLIMLTDHDDSADAVLIMLSSALMVLATDAENGPLPTANCTDVLKPTLVEIDVPLVSLSPFV